MFWGRHELGPNGVPVIAADPVLHCPEPLVLIRRQQSVMQLIDASNVDFPRLPEFGSRLSQGGDVVRDQRRVRREPGLDGLVRASEFSERNLLRRHLPAFDLRGSDGLRPEQEPGFNRVTLDGRLLGSRFGKGPEAYADHQRAWWRAALPDWARRIA